MSKAMLDVLTRIALALEQMSLENQALPPLPVTTPASSPALHRGTDIRAWVCPIHGNSKVVPAGFSQRTQKHYEAFTACGTPGCDQKPPRVAPVQLP